MALATQCPHCKTTFRVAHDQLKLRAGLVRCGACKQIFNGIEHLLPPSDGTQTTTLSAHASNKETPLTSTHSSASQLTPTAANSVSPSPSEALQTQPLVTPEPLKYPPTHTPLDQSETQNDPLQRMTLMDFTGNERQSETSVTDKSANPEKSLEEKSEETSKNRKTNITDFEEPNFVKRGRQRQRIGRTLRIFMAVGSFILLTGLVIQGIYIFRNQIAAWFPPIGTELTKACAILGCHVGLPTHIDALSIESNELQALSPNKNSFMLAILLRNHNSIPEAWPNIELTLNDTNEQILARRVLMPRDYLSPTQYAFQGIPSKSEQPVKLFFELSQLKPSGYRVYLFYP